MKSMCVLLLAAALAGGASASFCADTKEPAMRLGLGTLIDAQFSPDRQYAASCGGIGAILWSVPRSEIVRMYCAPDHYALAVAFSPDGTQLATGGSLGDILIWDVETATIVAQMGDLDFLQVTSLEFSGDGTKLLAGFRDSNARIFDASSGSVLRTISGHSSDVRSVAWSPGDSTIATASHDTTAKIWNAADGAFIRTLPHSTSLNDVEFSPDGTRLATCRSSGSGPVSDNISLWDAASGAEIRRFTGHTYATSSIEFSADGTRLLSASLDSRAIIWDVSTGGILDQMIEPDLAVRDQLIFARFDSDDSKALIGGSGCYFRIWDFDSNVSAQNFEGHTREVHDVRFSPDGTVLASAHGQGTFGRFVYLWDARTGKLLKKLIGHTGNVGALDYSDDGSVLISGANFGQIIFWDPNSGAPLRTYSAAGRAFGSLSLTPTGDKFLVSFQTHPIADIRASATGLNIHSLIGHAGNVDASALSRSGTLAVTGSFDDAGKLWDVETGTFIRDFNQGSDVWGAQFSHDDSKVLLTGDETKLWDVSTGALILDFNNPLGSPRAAAFSPDDSKVISCGFEDLVQYAALFDAATGSIIQRFAAHSGIVSSVDYSPNGTVAASGGWDGLTFVWNIESTPLRIADKLVIVAGGGDYPENEINEQTRVLAGRAYEFALVRGFNPAQIQYLSAIETPAENPNVDAEATTETLADAVVNWASDAASLTLYMAGPGTLDAETTESLFMVNGAASPRHSIDPADLKSILDSAQSGLSPLPRATAIIDASYSGGFVEGLSGPPGDAKRIVVSSTLADRAANFGPPGEAAGDVAFSSVFLTRLVMGDTFFEAFSQAKTAVETLDSPPTAPQTPLLDDNGDGAFTEADGELANLLVFGTYPHFGLLEANIAAASPSDVVVGPDGEVELQVELEVHPDLPIERVQAIAIDADASADGDVVDQVLIQLELDPSPKSVVRETASGPVVTRRYRGTFSAQDAGLTGPVSFAYSAIRTDGFGLELSNTVAGQNPLSRIDQTWAKYR